MSVPAATPIVEMQDIYKSYGSLWANRGISFSLLAGEIHGLLGENGAGKTTLMRVLFGLSRPDAGTILVEGQPVEIRSPKDALALGIGMVTQHFALVAPLTVTENVILGQTAGFHLDLEQAHRQVAEAAQRFGIRVDPHARVMDLSVGERQRVEILKALYRNVRVLILDEPTAVLTPQEVEQLFDSLRHLRRRGLSVVFISHKLHEVMDICDRVTVLRDGEVVGTVPVSQTSQAELARLMVGRATFGVTRKEHRPSEGEVLLRLEDLHALDNRGLPALQGVDLEVRSGEILGLAGVSGNGQTELAEVLSGTRNCSQGRVLLMGRDMTNAEPVALTAAGVGRIPEDRHEAVIPELSVADNLALEHLGDFTRRGVLDARAIREHARRLIEQYQIKARPEDPARTLSGGNLQKLVLARVLERNPRVLIVAQPTRGLDVGATEYIRSKLLEQRDRGAAILLISEDLDEILDLSDRIAVIYEGRIMATLPAQQADPETLGLLMSGVTPGAEKTAAAAGSD